MKRLKRSTKHLKPDDPAAKGISPDGVIGVWEFYMANKVVVHAKSRDIRYYLSFGVRSKQMFFYEHDTGKRCRVAQKDSSLYIEVLNLLDDWRHARLTKSMLENTNEKSGIAGPKSS